jgi:hypothetical protein
MGSLISSLASFRGFIYNFKCFAQTSKAKKTKDVDRIGV